MDLIDHQDSAMKSLLAAFVLLILLGLGLYLMLQPEEAGPPRPPIPVEERFEDKIVYTTDLDVDTASLRAHCEQLGGTFNPCGTICSPDAEICAEVCAYTCEEIPGRGPAFETAAWTPLQVQGFDFQLRYPEQEWSVAVDTSFSMSPKFNIYMQPAGASLDLPLDHFANVSHFSLFPRGIPTEGLFGKTRPFRLKAPFPISGESRLYLLEDGTPFAGMVKPARPPERWTDAGFVWMRVRTEDMEVRCIRDGREISREECDPLVAGDRIARTGTVDERTWETELAMLETLRFDAADLPDQDERTITLTEPRPEAVVSSPLEVSGRARGPWYFEGSFPVVLTNWDGLIIAESQAEAQDEWTTEEFVPFEAVLVFEPPYAPGDPDFMRGGTLIFRKANPSGLPENDEAVEIPVRFSG